MARAEREPGAALRVAALLDRSRHRLLYATQHPWLWVARLHRATLARSKRVIAITGSFGKTTTTRAVTVALGLSENGWTATGLNYFAVVPLQLLRQTARGSRAVVEVGLGAPGQMRHYARTLRPDVAILTSLGSEHLASFRDFDHLREEKLELIRAVRPGGAVLLNRDDPEVMRAAEHAPARVVTYGFAPEADVRALDARAEGTTGQIVSAVVGDDPVEVRSRLPGKSAVYPILAALAAAHVEGVGPSVAADRLAELRPSPGRLEPIAIGDGISALLDHYKAPLESHESALRALAAMPAARRLAILGEINSPPDHHACYRKVGALAAETVDRLLLVGVHPSRAKDYRKGALGAGLTADRITELPDFVAAGELLREELRRGDLVLVKGRSDQRLVRTVLLAVGAEVRCRVPRCPLLLAECRTCRLL